MPRVRIWALESTNDAKAVKHLADKLATHFRLRYLSIQTVGGIESLMYNKKGQSLGDRLRRTIQQYLKKDDYIIFVVDNDSPMALNQRKQESNSLINQIERIVGDQDFAGKVFFTPSIQELEAWLLIDCLGILCYFANQSPKYRTINRDRLWENQTFRKLISGYQKGNTEHIVETVAGGDGAKEYLIEFSEKILSELNPNMPQKNVNRKRYRESISPKISEYIAIDRETLQRNNSLRRLGNVLARFK